MDNKLQLLELPVSQLKPYDKNPRVHPADQIEKLCASIREFGFIQPILVNADYQITAGHGRYEAAKQLGLETVPCLMEAHLTETQRRAFIEADNRLAEGSSWDMKIVCSELQALQAVGFDLNLTGFDPKILEPKQPPKKRKERESVKTEKLCTCPQCGYEFVLDAE